VTLADLGGNRRIRRMQAARLAVEQAALRLFAEQGYEQTTVEEIADAAGISVRTLFRYYSSKQHILFGDVAQGRIDALRTGLWARPSSEEPLTAIEQALDDLDLTDPTEREQVLARFALLGRQPSLLTTYLVINRDLASVVAEFVAGRTGAAPTDLYPQMVAAATTAAWDTALVTWAASDGTANLSELRHTAFTALTAGLR
jgi:TetR/AcrR family transcriptional regulator, regulator of mycofactocin system